jgi:MFS family permease
MDDTRSALAALAGAAERPAPLRRGSARVALAIGILFMGSTLVTPLYRLYRLEFGFSALTLTLIYAVYVLGNLASLLLLGRISDELGRRRVLLPALGFAAAGTLLFLAALSTGWLFAARLASGAAIGLGIGTATAWLTELEGEDRGGRAALIATSANFAGLAAGPLLAGMLVEYAPWPLRLSYLAYLLLLALGAAALWRVPETVARPVQNWRALSLAPRLGIPSALRRRFLAPALTAVAAFAYLGFYAALVPSVLADSLSETSAAVGGLVVAELFLVAALANLALRRLKSRPAMRAGLGLLPPGLLCLVLAQTIPSLLILLLGTGLSGIAAALAYRGSLAEVNEMAPGDRRAELVSSYYLCCFFGNSVPVIGAGTLATVTGSLESASMVFAGVIALLALGALAMSWQKRP